MHKIVESRDQLRILSFDDLVGIDSPVRLLDEIVERVIIGGNIDLPTGNNTVGRRAYSAKDLVKLYLYGYVNGITSSRGLAKTTEVHVEFIWLIKGQKPSYKTISDFRKNNGPFIKEIFTRSIQMLMNDGLIKNNTWVIDGNKVKANARRDMLSVEKLRKKYLEYEEQIQQHIKELENKQSIDENDKDADSVETHVNSEKIADLEIKKKVLKVLIDSAEHREQNHISKTDKEALLLKTRRGMCAGFNSQTIVDDHNHLIVGVKLASIANDTQSLYPVIKSVAEETGVKPIKILADKGYTNFPDIEKVFNEITEGVIVAIQKNNREKSGLEFNYDSVNNQVVCPNGKILKYRGKQKAKGAVYDSYYTKECKGCSFQSECTKSKTSRAYCISENQEFIEFYKDKMQQEASKRDIKRRKAVVEHVFGTIAHMMHYNGFKLRGRLKVMTELYLYSFAYNLKRLFKLVKYPLHGVARGVLYLNLLNNALFLLYLSFLGIHELIFGRISPRIGISEEFSTT